MSVDESKVLGITDAKVWADEFCAAFGIWRRDKAGAAMAIDDAEGLMLGWFANAIETGRDAARNELVRVVVTGTPDPVFRDQVERAIKGLRPAVTSTETTPDVSLDQDPPSAAVVPEATTRLQADDGREWHVPNDRLDPWHVVDIDFIGYRLAHPLDCDLAKCLFDEVARGWELSPLQPGLYAWDKFNDQPEDWREIV